MKCEHFKNVANVHTNDYNRNHSETVGSPVHASNLNWLLRTGFYNLKRPTKSIELSQIQVIEVSPYLDMLSMLSKLRKWTIYVQIFGIKFIVECILALLVVCIPMHDANSSSLPMETVSRHMPMRPKHHTGALTISEIARIWPITFIFLMLPKSKLYDILSDVVVVWCYYYC